MLRKPAKRQRFRLADIQTTLERASAALEESARVLALLTTEPDDGSKRFMAWVGVEIDRRNQNKGDVQGMPAVIRAAHTDDLKSWIGGDLRRMEAAKRAALVQLDGDRERDVSIRWPDLAGYRKWGRP